MNEAEEPVLFQLGATECEEQLSRMFANVRSSFPIRTVVGEALLVAEAAAQRVSLNQLKNINTPSVSFAAPPDAFETIDRLTKLLFEPLEPQILVKGESLCGIDLMRWDTEGYVFGWYLDQQGKPHLGIGSCAHTVNLIAQALSALAPCDPEWIALLERHAQKLQELLASSRNRALRVAAERVASQGWFSRLWKPTSIDREMLSLGFDETTG